MCAVNLEAFEAKEPWHIFEVIEQSMMENLCKKEILKKWRV